MSRRSILTCLTLTLGVTGFSPATAAWAGNPAAEYTGEFERPFGFGYGEENRNYDANSRDVNDNRVIIDGRMIIGDDLSSLSTSGAYGYRYTGSGAGYGYGAGQATVVGNQLNVITQGSYNTVVIDSTQTNTGDQSVILNGELNLDD